MIAELASIFISLSKQEIYAYNSTGQLLYAAPISSGKATSPTPTGEFSIGSRYERTDLIGSDYRINLPYVMCLQGASSNPEEYCIHPTPYSDIPLDQQASRGCVRTNLDTARWLFNRAAIGTPVTIIK